MQTPAFPHKPATPLKSSAHLSQAGGLLMLVVSAVLTACNSDSPDYAADNARPVRTTAAEELQPVTELRLPGTLRATERVRPAFLQAGYLATRPVVRGERVQAGQVLASLRNPALNPAVAAAEARVAELEEQTRQAQRELARMEPLAESGALSADDLDRVRSRRDSAQQSVEQARAELAERRHRLTDATLRAPFDGRVVSVHAEPGDFIGAGEPVLELAGDGSGLEALIYLPGPVAARLAPGDTVQITGTDEATSGTGTLREIGLALPGQLAQAVVLLETGPTSTQEATPAWRSGQPVHVHIRWLDDKAVLVPLTALSSPGNGEARLYRVRNGRAEQLRVQVGRIHGHRAEVVAVADEMHGENDRALAHGDEIITAGFNSLADDTRVRILP